MDRDSPSSGTLYADKQAFEELVRSLLVRENQGSFGKLHVVTINHGEDAQAWARLAPKATRIAEAILHSRLAGDDACLQLAAGQYMLLFPRLNESEGMVRAAAIAREIKARLFGDTQSPLDVSVQVMALSRLQQRPAASAVEAMDKVLAAHPRPHGIELDVLFQPVWGAVDQAVVGNRARIRRRFHGQELFEAAVFLGGEQDSLAPDVNRILRAAAARCVRTGGMLFLPQAINDHAMTDDGEVAETTRELVRAAGGTVVVELAGAVASVPHPRLRGTIRTLLGAGVRVAVRSVPDLETARFLHDSGAEFLCMNEAQLRAAGLSASAVLALLTVFAHEVQELGFRTCLWNAALSQDIKRAEALGYSLFSGPSVGVNTVAPVEPHPLPAYKVYS